MCCGVEPFTFSILLTGSNPLGFITKTTEFKRTQTLLHSSLFIYARDFPSARHLKSLDLALTSAARNLVTHKKPSGGGGEEAKPSPGEGKRQREWEETEEEKEGGWVSLSLQKASYPRDIKALHSQHKISSEWCDSPRGEPVQCQSKKQKERKRKKERKNDVRRCSLPFGVYKRIYEGIVC